jgi:hypothetical protein
MFDVSDTPPSLCTKHFISKVYLLLGSRVTRCVCEKVAQNVAQPFFVKNSTQLLPWKKVAQLFVLFLYIIFTKTTYPKCKQSPNRRKFAQSGHPARKLAENFRIVAPLCTRFFGEKKQSDTNRFSDLRKFRSDSMGLDWVF